MNIFAIVVIIATERLIISNNNLTFSEIAYLKITTGLIISKRCVEDCFSRMFWYPGPTPGRIVPRSLRGPQFFPSDLYNGIWLNRTTGSACFSEVYNYY